MKKIKKLANLIVIFMIFGCAQNAVLSSTSQASKSSGTSNSKSLDHEASKSPCVDTKIVPETWNAKTHSICFEEKTKQKISEKKECERKLHPFAWEDCLGHIKVSDRSYEYQGEFLNGTWNGNGIFSSNNNLGKYVYVGKWANGKRDGIGYEFFKECNSCEQIYRKSEWRQGKIFWQIQLSSKSRILTHDLDKIENMPFLFGYPNMKNFECIGTNKDQWSYCHKNVFYKSGESYSGLWKNGKFFGEGEYQFQGGEKFSGIWSDGIPNGKARLFDSAGNNILEGEWKNGKFLIGAEVSSKKIDIAEKYENIFLNNFLSQNSQIYIDEKLSIQSNARFNKLIDDTPKKKFKPKISTTNPDANGVTEITIQTNSETASLKINGEEQGSSENGIYSIKRIAKAGKDTLYEIVVTDIYGNTEIQKITVNRPIAESQPKFAALNPSQIKKQPERDAVAIIIGIADYKNLPRADFANDDASMFYDYALRGLGIKPENVKLLVDANADDVAIYQAFKTWLPSRVRSTTDVYVYYSGHGLPAEDGQGLYLLPQRAHRDLIEKTAISQREINGFIQAAKPKSVTIFLDSCYSGLARTGETLLASARPVALKTDKKMFPDEFTVITASQADQISSSSPDLKHGIFSYYLMRGMEGDADANRDGKITVGEMHSYLSEQVTRQAGMMNRRQDPQLVGDANRVLVEK